MSREAALLLAWIVVGAAWLVAHAALLIRTARAPGLRRWERALAWLPPLTPIVSWKAGARIGAALWAASGVLYLMLRGME